MRCNVKPTTLYLEISPLSIPAPIRYNLTRTEMAVLEVLSRLWRVDKSRDHQHAPRAWPGREYLAKQTGRSIRSISRATSRLRTLGIIAKRQIRARNGVWHTTDYWPGRLLLRWIEELAGRLWRWAHNRVPFLAHNPGSCRPGEGFGEGAAASGRSDRSPRPRGAPG